MQHAELWHEFNELNQKKRWEPRTLSPQERDRWRHLRLEIERILCREKAYPAKDSREHIRVPASLTVFFHDRGELARQPVTTLGEGGCFICHPRPPEAGCELMLDLVLPRFTDSLTLKGKVVWWTAKPTKSGMGVQFVKLRPEQKATLFHFIDRLIATGLGLQER